MKPRHRILDFREMRDARGSLAFAQEGDDIPFTVRRIFMLYGMPDGARRGGHAHRAQHQLLLLTSGAGTADVDNGEEHFEIRLERPSHALYVPPMLWLDLHGFSQNAVCTVLASGPYDESDYIRDYGEFKRLAT